MHASPSVEIIILTIVIIFTVFNRCRCWFLDLHLSLLFDDGRIRHLSSVIHSRRLGLFLFQRSLWLLNDDFRRQLHLITFHVFIVFIIVIILLVILIFILLFFNAESVAFLIFLRIRLRRRVLLCIVPFAIVAGRGFYRFGGGRREVCGALLRGSRAVALLLAGEAGELGVELGYGLLPLHDGLIVLSGGQLAL